MALAALSTKLKNLLNGLMPGGPFGAWTKDIQLGTRLEELSTLLGAGGLATLSLVDSDGLIDATDPEGAFRELALGHKLNVETLAGHKTMLLSEALTANARMQALNPGAASYNVLLPPETNRLRVWIKNTSTLGGTLAVQDDAGGAVQTIYASDSALFVSNGTTWSVVAYVTGPDNAGRVFPGVDSLTFGTSPVGTPAPIPRTTRCVVVDTSGGAVEVQLPAADGRGREFLIVATDTSNSIRVRAQTGNTVDGSASGGYRDWTANTDPACRIYKDVGSGAWIGIHFAEEAEKNAHSAVSLQNSAVTNPALANGATAGKLKTANDADYRIAGALYTKAATEDLFDLTGQTNTGVGEYLAVGLDLNAAGTASLAVGAVSADADEALDTLPAVDPAKARIGVYIAGPSTNFAAALAAQGTIINGSPILD